jgi:hypothetical protein
VDRRQFLSQSRSSCPAVGALYFNGLQDFVGQGFNCRQMCMIAGQENIPDLSRSESNLIQKNRRWLAFVNHLLSNE